MDPMTIALLGSTALGGLGGFFGGGGSSGPQRQSTNSSSAWNQTQSTEPLPGVTPFFFGSDDGTRGLFHEAARLYNTSGFSPEMGGLTTNWLNDALSNYNDFRNSGARNAGAQLSLGQFDPNVTPAASIVRPAAVTPTRVDDSGRVTAGNVSLPGSRAEQGVLDPTAALQGFLAGESTSPWVGLQQKAVTDMLTRNMLENVMPQVRHDAIAAGQYGGSRGDMATGLAMSRLNTDLAPSLFGMAGQAYEAEQGRKYGVATDLNRQAVDTSTGNANRTLQADMFNLDAMLGAQKFNASLDADAQKFNAGTLLDTQKFNIGTTLNNNAQEMQRAAQDVSNRGAGLSLLTGAQGATDQYYGDMLQALGIPTDYAWDRLAQYGSLVQPALNYTTQNGAGTSNSSGVTTGTGQGGGGGGLAGAFGGAATGLGIGMGLFGNGGPFSRARAPNTAGSVYTDRGSWF